MYWTDTASDTIERASMDGLSRTVLHSTGLSGAFGLTLDYESQTLYWTDQHFNRIESSSVNGSNRQIIVSNLLDPFGITYYEGNLYWADTSYLRIFTFSVESLSSRLVTLTGYLYDRPYYIHVVSEDRQPFGEFDAFLLACCFNVACTY